MSLVLDDLLRDPDRLLQHLQRMTEVVAQQNASLASLQDEHNAVLAERDAARTERDLLREERDAAQAEVEKLRLLIRQLQRGQFGRRSEKLDPDQLQLGLEDLEQTVAAAEVAQEAASRSSDAPRPPRVRRRNLGALPAHLPRRGRSAAGWRARRCWPTCWWPNSLTTCPCTAMCGWPPPRKGNLS